MPPTHSQHWLYIPILMHPEGGHFPETLMGLYWCFELETLIIIPT